MDPLKLEDLVREFECRSTLYRQEIRQGALADARTVVRKLGSSIAVWVGDPSRGWTWLSFPLRRQGRIWEHEKRDDRIKITIPLDEDWTLYVVIETGVTDHWSVQLSGPGSQTHELVERPSGWRTADGRAAIGELSEPNLVLSGRPIARWTGDGPTLQLPPHSLRGGLLLPPGRIEVWVGDGATDQMVGLLGTSAGVPVDESVADMADPRVSLRTPDHFVDGQPLTTTSSPIQIVTTFTGLQRGTGGTQHSLRAHESLSRLVLTGESLKPPELSLEIEHRLAGPGLASSATARRTKVTGKGTEYQLLRPYGLAAGQPAIGELAISTESTELGTIEVLPPPLRARWKHPSRRSAAAKMPRLEAKASSLTQSEGAGLSYRLQANGLVHYAATSQLGELWDYDFRALIPTPGSLKGLSDLVDAHGELEAWLPDSDATILRARNPLPQVFLDELAEASRGGQVLRLGQPRTNLRGVLDPAALQPLAGTELQPSSGLFHFDIPVSSQPATVYHRGLRLEATLERLSPPEEEEQQAALLLKAPLDIAVDAAPELSPFWPVRAWRDDSQVRIQTGPESTVLQPRGDAIPWSSADELSFHWPGIGFYPGMEPDRPDGRFAWRGLIFRGSGPGLRFEGWLIRTEATWHPAAGPFASWGLVLGQPGQVQTDAGLLLDKDGLDELPDAVREVAELYLNGSRRDRGCRVPTSDGDWSVKPRGSHPRRPPEHVLVAPPGGPKAQRTQAPAGRAGVRVWLEQP